MPVFVQPTTPLAFADAVGSILAGLVNAQRQSAQATVEFVESVGFETTADGEQKLRMVNFTYRKLDEHQEEAEFTCEVPLLSLVPIPALSVKRATVAFSYDVQGTVIRDTPRAAPEASQPLVGRAALVANAAILQGRVLRPAAGTSAATSAGELYKGAMQVSIELESGVLPTGLERIMNIMDIAASGGKKVEPPS